MLGPFIKVEWEDTPENITQERIKRVKTYFQNKYNTKNVKIKTIYISNDTNTKLKSLDVNDSILDHQYQKKLMKDFMEENGVTVKWDLINRLDDKVNAEINKTSQTTIRYNKWYLKRVEFSNFLSFGQDNVIDFTKFDGITVIESNPKNFGGKTIATIDLLLFLFFNTTTKSKVNADIFNQFTDANEVKVKGYLTIDDCDYEITRTITRKKSKSGEWTVKSDLDYRNVSVEKGNENEEQRAATEKIIKSAIGSQEDFLSTILTTGNNLEELIDSKPTARGQILTRFLGLEALKLKEDICKNMYSEWLKKLISNTFNIAQLEIDNDTYTKSIEDSNNEITRLVKELTAHEKQLKELQEKRDKLLQSMNNDIDKELINTNPVTVEKDIADLTKKKDESKKSADAIIVKEPSEYYLEDDHKKIIKEIADLKLAKGLNMASIKSNKKLIENFENGTICPTCKRSFEDVDHTEEINKIKEEILIQEKEDKKSEEKITELEKSESKFAGLKKEYDEYEKNKLRKSKFELEYEQKDLEINAKKLLLERYESSKKKLEENKKIENEAIGLKVQIESKNGDIKQNNITTEKHKNNIANMSEKIDTNKNLIKKIKSEEEYVVIFKTYLTIYGKNGISKVIMKNMIPLLNQELQRILSDSCYFLLELSINDKNELEFLMIDNETRVVKSLSSGSGYEKTISSLALRSVLTKISSLPKPNIVVMDEFDGKVADENLPMVGEFFKHIKNYFEHIILITHRPLIRNWGDNIITIKKEDNVSSIDYITTKIS